jgi:hypothetical protein
MKTYLYVAVVAVFVGSIVSYTFSVTISVLIRYLAEWM